MKHIFYTLIVIIFCVNKSIAQNAPLVKLVKNQSKKIKSGSYTVHKSHKFFDVEEIKEIKLTVQFCEVGQNTICIVKNLLENTLQIFDTSQWTYYYSYKDSILKVFNRGNPNRNLLYLFMQPYAFIHTLPPNSDYSKLITEDLKNYTITFTPGLDAKMPEIRNDFYKFTIDKKLLVPIKYQNYSEEWLDSINYNIQNMVEEISDVKINIYKETNFIKLVAETLKNLPVKKTYFPEYENTLIKQKVSDTIRSDNWELYQTSNNEKYKFNESKRKYNILYFTYMGCVPCKKALPVLDSLYLKWNDKVNFYAIDMFDKNAAKIEIYRKANHIKFNYYFSDKNNGTLSVINELNLHSYPTFIIVNEKGIILEKIEGLNSDLFNQIEQNLKF